MSLTVSNTTQSLAVALKGIHRTESIEANKKNVEPSAKTIAKAVTLAISTDARDGNLTLYQWASKTVQYFSAKPMKFILSSKEAELPTSLV